MNFWSQFFPIKPIFSKNSQINGKVTVIENDGVRSLVINGYTQSKSLSKNGKSEGYWDKFLEVTEENQIFPKKILILGFGAGTTTFLFGKRFPEVDITGVEIDPVVVEASNLLYDFSSLKLNVITTDVTKMFTKESFKKVDYDTVIVDVYEDGIRVPDIIYSRHYLENLKELLKKKGLLMFNQAFRTNYKREYNEFAERLNQVFGNVGFKEVQTSSNVIVYCIND